MPTRKEPWRETFDHAAKTGLRVSIIGHGGELLAIANWQAGLVEYWEVIGGKRWHEYVLQADLPRVLEWFKKGTDEAPPITYQGLGRCCGKDQIVTVSLVKVAAPGNVWLVAGGQSPSEAFPVVLRPQLTEPERLETLALLKAAVECLGCKHYKGGRVALLVSASQKLA